MKRYIIPVLALVFSIAFFIQAEASSYVDVTPHEAKMLMENNKDLVIIDVSPYFNRGHIPGAVNYPVGSGALDDAIGMLDLSKAYLVYCHADGPAIAGAKKLLKAGAMKVYRLKGNYSGWVAAGYPVEM